ncbi:MAG TPA: hypothetical protein VFQ61_08740 [Polyangiaceae bacterium]|nr:hypothetical protein [Polyangiaceae bacterium]
MRKTILLASAVLYLPFFGCGPDTCKTGFIRQGDLCVEYGAPEPPSSNGGSTGNGGSNAAGDGSDAGGTATASGGKTPANAGGAATGGKASSGGKNANGGDTVASNPGGADAGGTSQSDGGATSEPPDTTDVAFAELCTMHTDCAGTTNYCAFSAFEPAYCSISGCDADPSICPPDWSCFNVGDFVPGEPWVCVKPPPATNGNGEMGSLCNSKTDCFGATNYCAYSPTEPAYCSVSGCDADPALCPTGYMCLNVGDFVPGEPWVCVKAPAM